MDDSLSSHYYAALKKQGYLRFVLILSLVYSISGYTVWAAYNQSILFDEDHPCCLDQKGMDADHCHHAQAHLLGIIAIQLEYPTDPIEIYFYPIRSDDPFFLAFPFLRPPISS